MTAYADFEFYRDTFLGEKIPEERFPQFARDASVQIDRVTFNRLKNAADIPEEVKNACCAAAEVLYLTEDASVKAAGGISSETVGEHSITYSASVGTSSSANGSVRSAIKDHLANTGLMSKVVEQ